MARYAMVDGEGTVTNICEWDGESEWSPPEGITLIQCEEEPNAERGGTYIDGVFTRHPDHITQPEPEAEETPAE